MKTTIRLLLAAAVLAATSAAALAAAEGITDNNGATSVAEMMHRKHERQLRALLVSEGRADEVRQLDEDNATQMREEQENRYNKANAALARGGNADVQAQDPLLNGCDPYKLPR